MRLLQETEIKLEWTDLNRPASKPIYEDYECLPDYVGVTTILREIALKLGMLKVDDEDVTTIPLRMALGMGWEWVASKLYPGMVWQPGIMASEGLVGHPDGLSCIPDVRHPAVPDVWVVEEFKFTHKTAREKKIQDQWLWIQQVMGYMNLVNKTDYLGSQVNRARLHVCYGLGDYTRPYTEKYIRYLIEFSETDLRMNWDMLKRGLERIANEGKG